MLYLLSPLLCTNLGILQYTMNAKLSPQRFCGTTLIRLMNVFIYAVVHNLAAKGIGITFTRRLPNAHSHNMGYIGILPIEVRKGRGFLPSNLMFCCLYHNSNTDFMLVTHLDFLGRCKGKPLGELQRKTLVLNSQ